jgi:hypothetical protein
MMKPTKPAPKSAGASSKALPPGAYNTPGSKREAQLKGAPKPTRVEIGKEFVSNPKGGKPLVLGGGRRCTSKEPRTRRGNGADRSDRQGISDMATATQSIAKPDTRPGFEGSARIAAAELASQADAEITCPGFACGVRPSGRRVQTIQALSRAPSHERIIAVTNRPQTYKREYLGEPEIMNRAAPGGRLPRGALKANDSRGGGDWTPLVAGSANAVAATVEHHDVRARPDLVAKRLARGK